ncbi:MAG TPA: methionine biosynthesis protein MetW [Bryobacteraceae bacterium]|nr:methionine biosynthesis protein MetW [Bryobacteraceae bacterium]
MGQAQAMAAIHHQQPVTLSERPDFHVIGEIVEPGSRVLDLGCGEGELLAWLVENKRVLARGVEISSAQVRRAIARGVSTYQGDIDEGLADYPDKAFDYVILSQTLHETRAPLQVLREMLRVGRRAIISFPNFGHWSVRLAMLLNGQAPKTRLFPHNWYNSPNIRFLSINDFESLCRDQNFPIERRFFLAGARQIGTFPNLIAQTAVFLLG